MTKINPYLNFNGDALEAFSFYKSVFGGEFAGVMRYKDMPEMPENKSLSDDDKEKVMHIALPIGGGNVLMASDVSESFGHTKVEGNNIYLSISAESKEEADRLFNGLSEGGKIEMRLGDTFWNAYFGMFEDKFGIHWMVSFDY